MYNSKTNKSVLLIFLLVMSVGLGLLFFDSKSDQSETQKNIIGNFKQIKGKVEYKENTYSGWSSVKSKNDVVNQSTVFTHDNAKANIDIDGVEVLIDENSMVKIERPEKIKKLDLSFGSLIFDSKQKQTVILKINNKEMTINLDNSRVKIVQAKGSEKVRIVSLRGKVEVKEKDARHLIESQQNISLDASTPLRKEEFKIISPLNNEDIYIHSKKKKIKLVASAKISSLRIENSGDVLLSEINQVETNPTLDVELNPGQYKLIAVGENGEKSQPVFIQVHQQKKIEIGYKKEFYKITPTQLAPKLKLSINLPNESQFYVKRTEDVNWLPVYGLEWQPSEPGSYEIVAVQESQVDYESESERALVQITEDDFKTIRPQPQVHIALAKTEPEKLKPVSVRKKRAPAQVESQMRMVSVGHRKHTFSLGSRFFKQNVALTSTNIGTATYQDIFSQAFFLKYKYKMSPQFHVYAGFDYNPISMDLYYKNTQTNYKKSYDRKNLDIGSGYSMSKGWDILGGLQVSQNKLIYPGVSEIELLQNDTLKLLVSTTLEFSLSQKQALRFLASVAPVGMYLGQAESMKSQKVLLQYLAGIEYSYSFKNNFMLTSDLNYMTEGYRYDYSTSLYTERDIQTQISNFDLGLRLSYLF